jgi:hypothetical protein
VIAQLRWSARLLETDCPKVLRPALFSAVGHLSSVGGAMAFDAYVHDDARRMFAFGLSCAEAVGNWHLRAKLLSTMSRQAVWCGDVDDGLTYIEMAFVRSDRLTATERAMLHTARARALAKFGHVQETLRAVAYADEAFARSEPERDRPWMAYYDQAQHYGDTGHALFDLAMHSCQTAEAIGRLNIAVQGHDAVYARSRLFSTAKLATLMFVSGDPLEAAIVGRQALHGAEQLHSRRVAEVLHELSGAAHKHIGVSDVKELCGTITALVGSS